MILFTIELVKFKQVWNRGSMAFGGDKRRAENSETLPVQKNVLRMHAWAWPFALLPLVLLVEGVRAKVRADQTTLPRAGPAWQWRVRACLG